MQEPKKYPTFADEGPNGQPIARVVTKQGFIPMSAGFYRLVCGVPRKLWSLQIEGQAGLLEAYVYELKEKIRQELSYELYDIRTVTNRVQPAEVYEIEGYFDSDGCYWPAGAKAKVRWPLTGGFETIDLPDWRFSLYEGDKLYRQNGELILSLLGVAT